MISYCAISVNKVDFPATAAGRLKVCMVGSVVYDKSTGKTTSETRFFISSLPVDPKRALEAIRAHWGVEAMHRILDMDFDEDRSRARREDLAENLAMLRHVVINVLRLDKSVFGGISVKSEDRYFTAKDRPMTDGGVRAAKRFRRTRRTPHRIQGRKPLLSVPSRQARACRL